MIKTILVIFYMFLFSLQPDMRLEITTSAIILTKDGDENSYVGIWPNEDAEWWRTTAPILWTWCPGDSDWEHDGAIHPHGMPANEVPLEWFSAVLRLCWMPEQSNEQYQVAMMLDPHSFSLGLLWGGIMTIIIAVMLFKILLLQRRFKENE